MTVSEKAAYIKGLFDGYEISKDSKEGRVLSEMLDLIGKMSERICDLEQTCVELHDYIEELDHDLGSVEEDLYLTDGEDDEFEEEFENDFEDSDSGYDEIVCPGCGEVVCVDDSVELSEVICPACGESFGDIELCDGDCDGCTEDCSEE